MTFRPVLVCPYPALTNCCQIQLSCCCLEFPSETEPDVSLSCLESPHQGFKVHLLSLKRNEIGESTAVML